MKLDVHGPNGLNPAYAYTGGKPFDAALPCVVFVHGAMNDHSVWTLLARWFAHHGFGVLAVDLPGHRRSVGPALKSVEAMADWLLALLDAACVQQAMLGTCVPMPVPQPLLDLSLADPLAAIERVVTFSHSTLAAKPSYPGPGVWLRGAARALMRQVLAAQGDASLFHTDFSACNGYTDGLAAAARVRCPAHLVLGAQDQMTLPRGARDVAALLKATVHTVPAGHALMAESPDPVLAALRAAFTT